MSAKKNATVKEDNAAAFAKRLAELEEENIKLKEKLSGTTTKKEKSHFGWLKKSGVVFFLTLSIVTFMLFNLSSWVKNTLLDTDTFVATMQPVISEPAVQKRIQDEITNNLFAKVDIEAKLQENLPENIAFLSDPLSSQIESFTYNKVGDVIESEKIYNLWGKSLESVHSKVVGYIENENADGVVTVNDVYASISSQVSDDAKLSFLFNRELPEKVGSINLKEIEWLPEARAYVNALKITPIIFLLTSIVSFILAIVLAVQKRRVLYAFVVLSIIMLGVTLLAVTGMNTFIGSEAKPENAAAAQAIYSTVTQPLENRTLGYISLLGVGLLVLIATSGMSYIKKARNFLDKKIVKLADTILPKANVPQWLLTFESYIAVIAWTAFAVVFIALGFRIPPEYNQVISGFIWAVTTVLALYIVRVCVVGLSKTKSK